ncbi:hypothetical protein N7534_012107 [Penicillium rubens]|nr:hypothetical protein N7534_012107 [Penicillium rubens]
MPARAHRRAPDPLAGAVSPLPPCRGLSPMAPGGRACSVRPPTKAPGKVAPFDPRPPAVRRTGESVKSPYLPPPSRVFTDPPPKPRLPKPREGAPAPCVHPAPRASRSAARFARRLRLHLTPSTSPAGAASSPAAPAGAPRPPLPRAAKPRRPPLAPGLGEGDRRWRTVTWGPACRGSYREGHPARAPTVTSPAIPAPPTQRDAATLAGPHSLSPGPLGPGRFYTDSPTPFGV